MDKENKIKRILLLYEKLRKGEIVNKKELAIEFGVSGRTIQRDIDDVRAYLAEKHNGEEITYDTYQRGYNICGVVDKELSGSELLSIVKILLDSRAFIKDEMNGLIDSLLNTSSENDKKFIKSIIGNELIHFQALKHEKPLIKIIWDLCFCIKKKQLIMIEYEKMNGEKTERTVKPISIVFSEYYFYLIAFIENSKYQTPAFFRVDRIGSFQLLDQKFPIPEKLRFEDGLLRKRTQFMYGGDLMTIKFNYFGASINSVLDRFPTAIVKKNLGNGWLIEAEVYGKGCTMWLLSQGQYVEVLEPFSIREELIAIIEKMSSRYKTEGDYSC
ncbi:helix-turn-helix transcriptional regulator [Cytobacillus sp. FJAT-53684]|uniref:Helix-turn-helix transcriptional regulator n=1 Tax=Cytobacillus mangrovibacter TaxID=3299024 RepID=A0ABW6K3Z2_9BACI